MPAVDRFKLLHGPYRPPKTRRDAKLFCEVRGTVTVGGYHDGPIPWPRVKKGGRPCLILCGDLVRAVRSESRLAVAHHFGVAEETVWTWRKALGLPQYTEGTRKLRSRVAKGWADSPNLNHGNPIEHTGERRAKVAAAWRRKGHGPAGPGARLWAAEEDALLGTMPAKALAARLGRTVQAVHVRRSKLGIPPYRG